MNVSLQVSHILRKYTRFAYEPLKILTAPTHERYQSAFARLPHTFYLYQDGNIKGWNEQYAKLPPNHILLPRKMGEKQIPDWLTVDLVWSQNKFGQFQILAPIAKYLRTPFISLEHTLPVPSWNKQILENTKKMRGDINVFISEYSREKWGWSENEAIVIHHGVDSNIFRLPETESRKPVLLSVVNDWVNRDGPCGYNFWKEATYGLPVMVVGDTPGLSKPASSLSELVETYQSAQIFVNTSLVSPIPTSLLEAMSAGCCCISTDTAMIPEVIKHNVNGLLASSPSEMRKLCIDMLKKPEKCRELGLEAAKTVAEKFSMEVFLDKWDATFRKAVQIGTH